MQLLNSHLFGNLIIQCGEIDGVVLGSWTNVNESSSEPVIDEDNAHAGYWAAAAVWSNAWDQKTIDRVSDYFFCVRTFQKMRHIVLKLELKKNVLLS